MLFSTILSLFAAGAVMAEVDGHADKKSAACAKELEQIVYTPPNCAYAYLKRITNTLRAQSPLFWQNRVQAKAAFESFEQTYNVNAVVITPMGTILDYPEGPIATDINNFGHSIQRANLDGEGFSTGADTYYYVTIFRGSENQMFYVKVTMDKVNAPYFCK